MDEESALGLLIENIHYSSTLTVIQGMVTTTNTEKVTGVIAKSRYQILGFSTSKIPEPAA